MSMIVVGTMIVTTIMIMTTIMITAVTKAGITDTNTVNKKAPEDSPGLF